MKLTAAMLGLLAVGATLTAATPTQAQGLPQPLVAPCKNTQYLTAPGLTVNATDRAEVMRVLAKMPAHTCRVDYVQFVPYGVFHCFGAVDIAGCAETRGRFPGPSDLTVLSFTVMGDRLASVMTGESIASIVCHELNHVTLSESLNSNGHTPLHGTLDTTCESQVG